MSDPKVPLSYAPTSGTSYTPSQSDSVKYHREFDKRTLIKSTLHKEVYDSLAEIYSILTVMEMVETSFIKDYVSDKDKYTSTTLRLINQYSMVIKDMKDPSKKRILNEIFPGVSDDDMSIVYYLAKKYNLHAPSAIKRVQIGIPATMELRSSQVEISRDAPQREDSTRSPGAQIVAQITGGFITCMDSLKLNYRTKDKLHPLLSELVVNLNDMVTKNLADGGESTTVEFPGKLKLVSWLIKLNNLDDNQLSEQEADSFLEDLDSAYKNFYTSLE